MPNDENKRKYVKHTKKNSLTYGPKVIQGQINWFEIGSFSVKIRFNYMKSDNQIY